MKKIYFLAAAAALFMTACNEGPQGPETKTIDFENVELQATSGTYSNILWGKEKAVDNGNGSKVYDGVLYSDQGAGFGSYFNDNAGEDWGPLDTWGGFAFSSNNVLEDTDTPYDYSTQFSAYARQVSKFAVGYDLGGYNGGEYERPFITFDSAVSPLSARVANTNKAYYYCKSSSIENFYFTLIINGYNGTAKTGDVEVKLAADGQVLDNWQDVDLAPLGNVNKIEFKFDSNDSSEYGLNVPAFFCLDDLKFTMPE